LFREGLLLSKTYIVEFIIATSYFRGGVVLNQLILFTGLLIILLLILKL